MGGGGEGEREGLGSILTKGKYPHEGEVSSRRLDMPQKLFVDCTLSTPFSHDLHIGHLKTASRLLGT